MGRFCLFVLLHRMKSDVSNRARSRSPKKKAGLDYCAIMCVTPFYYQKSAQSADELLGMLNERPINCTALSKGPLEALRHSGLHFKSKEERAKWTAEARLDAILGGCQASVGSVKSGLRCYLAFAGSYNRYSCCASFPFLFSTCRCNYLQVA